MSSLGTDFLLHMMPSRNAATTSWQNLDERLSVHDAGLSKYEFNKDLLCTDAYLYRQMGKDEMYARVRQVCCSYPCMLSP